MSGSPGAGDGPGVVLWDFDGTLAHRLGRWAATLVETLDVVLPGHGRGADDVRPGLRDVLPWHHPGRPHPELDAPVAWWTHVGGVLQAALAPLGIRGRDAEAVAAAFPAVYLDPARWVVDPDARPALRRLAGAGWRNLVVSNHVPELAGLVTALGLDEHLDAVLTSALVGHEKPHPAIFEAALDAAGRPEVVWMVGDNPDADIAGAAALGIPGVLVRPATGAAPAVTPLDAARTILRPPATP